MALTAPAPAGGRPSAGGTAPVVVVTGWREPERARWLPTLSSAWTNPSDVHRPVVALNAPAYAHRPAELLRHVLFALGKSPHVTGGTKDNAELAECTAAWLLARRTSEIIVGEAPQVAPAVLRHLVELAAGVGARIWLVAHHNRSDTLSELAELWGATEWELDAFDRAWGWPTDRPEAAQGWDPPAPAGSDLPHTSALTFRYDCQQLLSPARYAQIDALYRAEFAGAQADFDAHAAAGTLEHEAVAAHLRRRVRQARSTEAVVVAVRAVEAAALLHSFQVEADLPMLINSAERNPRPGLFGDDAYAVLDAYTPPKWAAVGALTACDIPAGPLSRLLVGDVAEDRSTVITSDGPVAVPTALQPYLHAQLLMRSFEGAAPEDNLLLNERNEAPRVEWVARIIKVIEVETRLRLARTRTDRKRLTVFEWMTAHGLSVRKITGVEPVRKAGR